MIGALLFAVIAGYAANVLYGPAVLWIAALSAICIGYAQSGHVVSRKMRIVFAVLTALGVLALGTLLSLHALPGFHNFPAFENVVLSKGAAPYTLYLNFDKTLVGLGILGFTHRSLLASARQWNRAAWRAAPLVPISIIAVALGALALGYLTWQPKWTSLFWIWAPANLFFVCLSEEAFFRGFIQRELTSCVGSGLAIAVSAVLFGLAHIAGGVSYVVLATAAGLGYAIVYHRTQSIEMSMLAHFGLNATHFLLFTYPRTL
jgi:uncharacterized protein